MNTMGKRAVAALFMKDWKRSNTVRIAFVFAPLLLTLAVASPASGRGTPENPTLWEGVKQCNEVAAFFAVDPAIAKRWVPPAFELAIDAQGKAGGGVILFNCPDRYFLATPDSPPLAEGDNLAPTGEVHFWFVLQGPAQVLPVPGAQVTAPTGYYYDVADLVTSPVARSVYRRAGRNPVLISGVTVVDQGKTQTGDITFLDGSRITYTAFTPTQFSMPLRFGGNLWNWHVGGSGEMGGDLGVHLDPAAGNPSNVNTTRVQFLALVPGPPNSTQVTIHADPGTLFADYFGSSDAVSSRATFFRPNNIANNSSRGGLAWTTYPPSPIPAPPLLP